MLTLTTGPDVTREAAEALRTRRLALGLRQADLATRSGVPVNTIRRFERSGKIGFERFAKLLASLGLADAVLAALAPPPQAPASIEEFLAVPKTRQRGLRRPPQ
jgi:transcriptional regulator with XRE-family HTH domain